jgi:hypothetical protein
MTEHHDVAVESARRHVAAETRSMGLRQPRWSCTWIDGLPFWQVSFDWARKDISPGNLHVPGAGLGCDEGLETQAA